MSKALGHMISAHKGWRSRSAMCAVNHVSIIKTLGTKLGGAALTNNIPCLFSHITAGKVNIVHDSVVKGQLKGPRMEPSGTLLLADFSLCPSFFHCNKL